MSLLIPVLTDIALYGAEKVGDALDGVQRRVEHIIDHAEGAGETLVATAGEMIKQRLAELREIFREEMGRTIDHIDDSLQKYLVQFLTMVDKIEKTGNSLELLETFLAFDAQDLLNQMPFKKNVYILARVMGLVQVYKETGLYRFRLVGNMFGFDKTSTIKINGAALSPEQVQTVQRYVLDCHIKAEAFNKFFRDDSTQRINMHICTYPIKNKDGEILQGDQIHEQTINILLLPKYPMKIGFQQLSLQDNEPSIVSHLLNFSLLGTHYIPDGVAGTIATLDERKVETKTFQADASNFSQIDQENKYIPVPLAGAGFVNGSFKVDRPGIYKIEAFAQFHAQPYATQRYNLRINVNGAGATPLNREHSEFEKAGDPPTSVNAYTILQFDAYFSLRENDQISLQVRSQNSPAQINATELKITYYDTRPSYYQRLQFGDVYETRLSDGFQTFNLFAESWTGERMAYTPITVPKTDILLTFDTSTKFKRVILKSPVPASLLTTQIRE